VCDSLALNLRCVVFSRLEERLLFIHVHHVKRFIDAWELINIIHFINIAIGNLESLKRMIPLLSPPLVVNLGAARIFFLTRIHSIDLVEQRQVRCLITLLVLLGNNWDTLVVVTTVQILDVRLPLDDLVNTYKFSSNPADFRPFKLVLVIRLCLKFIRKHLRKLVFILRILIIA
jgi:hypothetical protein